jgi:hypothetical protein
MDIIRVSVVESEAIQSSLGDVKRTLDPVKDCMAMESAAMQSHLGMS